MQYQHGTGSVKLTLTTAEIVGEMLLNGKAIASGKQSDAINLASGGSTNIVASVTSQDGKTTTVYRVVAAREPDADAALKSFDLGGTVDEKAVGVSAAAGFLMYP